MNIVILSGRTGKDVEVKYTNNQLAVGRTSLAVTDGFGDKAKTGWYNLVVFGKQAENMEKIVPKGTRIIVHGHLQQDSWEKDGQKHTSVSVIVDKFEYAQSKPDGATATSQPQPTPVPVGADGMPDFMQMSETEMESLPFD